MVQRKSDCCSMTDGFISFFGVDDGGGGSVVNQDGVGSTLMKSETLSLPPEDHFGNVEYKRTLVNPCDDRIEHLISQMKWRLAEGNGVALYELGVDDDGTLTGMSANDLQSSLLNIERMVARLEAQMDIIRMKEIPLIELPNCIRLPSKDEDRRKFVVEILIHTNQSIERIGETRVVLLGAADSGKSSLIGTICSSNRDDGNGRSRLSLFRHLHEIITGRTSSITEQSVGIDKESGTMLNYDKCRNSMEILPRSNSLITFVDLAGHRKYQRTTLFGITSRHPHLCLLVISKCRGLVTSILNSVNYLMHLNIRPIIVVTKDDLYSSSGSRDIRTGSPEQHPTEPQTNNLDLDEIVDSLQSYDFIRPLPPVRIVQLDGLNMNDFSVQFLASGFTPLVRVSSVTGDGLSLLCDMIVNVANQIQLNKEQRPTANPSPVDDTSIEFQIDQVYSSFNKELLIVKGYQYSGSMAVNDHLCLGPFRNDVFHPVKIKSIRRLNVPISCIHSGQSGSLALAIDSLDCGSIKQKGLVILKTPSKVCRSFLANVSVLSSTLKGHNLRTGCLLTVHMGNICQTVVIDNYQREEGRVKLTFYRRSEYVQMGRKFILRNNTVHVVGQVTQLLF